MRKGKRKKVLKDLATLNVDDDKQKSKCVEAGLQNKKINFPRKKKAKVSLLTLTRKKYFFWGDENFQLSGDR